MNYLRFFSRRHRCSFAIITPSKEPKDTSTATSAVLLLFPVTTFCLGTWQIYRLDEKETLLKTIEKRIKSNEVLDVAELLKGNVDVKEYEYYPVKMTGKFLNDKEMFMGPKSRHNTKDSGLGFHVVTPFRVQGSGAVVLVNRGWIPLEARNPSVRQEDECNDTVEIKGICRTQESRPLFGPKEKHKHNTWSYRTIDQMATVAGSTELFFDLVTDFGRRNQPVPNQTRVSIPNNHLSYIFTWYGLTIASIVTWIQQVYRK